MWCFVGVRPTAHPGFMTDFLRKTFENGTNLLYFNIKIPSSRLACSILGMFAKI